MNLFQLVAKQMRQRALSTWLTLLSVTLGVALAIALLVFQREGGKLFGQTEFGYDLIVGAKGSKLQLVLNTAYGLDEPPGTIPWSVYEAMSDPALYAPSVNWAVPIIVADTYAGHRIVATMPSLLGYTDDANGRLPDGKRFAYRLERELELAQGRPFHAYKFEAVIGAEAVRTAGLRLGDRFRATHGTAEAPSHEHEETWEVVGILEPTGTSLDRLLFIPIPTSQAIELHGDTLGQIQRLLNQGARPEDLTVDRSDLVARGAIDREYYVQEPETGIIHLKVPESLWQVSGIYVNTYSGPRRARMEWDLNHRPEAMAVNPASEMRQFFEQFLEAPSRMLLYVTILVSVVAAVSILVSIYNSVSARRREIAILRSLGATRARVLALICMEAGLIGLAGGLVGWLAGHGLAAVASEALRQRLGEGIDWLSVGPWELAYVGAVVALAVAAGLVPALKAYSTPVAQNLSE